MKNQGDFEFDVRQSVQRRNVTRLVVGTLFSLWLVWFGTWLMPAETVLAVSVDAIESWNFWTFAACVCIACGIWGLLKELAFAFRSSSTSGEWHFRLRGNDLLWHVPDHAHGTEQGFEARLDELQKVEFKTIQAFEETDRREYWVHFKHRDPIQLQSYSGVSLSWLVQKIASAGVPYEETHESH